MRTNPFEYKKTRKVVQKFQGLSVDFTVQEAADLKEVLGNMCGDSKDGVFYKLYLALDTFVKAQPERPKAGIKCPCFSVIQNP